MASVSSEFKSRVSSLQKKHRALFATRKTATMLWRTKHLTAAVDMCEEKKNEIAAALTADLG